MPLVVLFSVSPEWLCAPYEFSVPWTAKKNVTNSDHSISKTIWDMELCFGEQFAITNDTRKRDWEVLSVHLSDRGTDSWKKLGCQKQWNLQVPFGAYFGLGVSQSYVVSLMMLLIFVWCLDAGKCCAALHFPPIKRECTSAPHGMFLDYQNHRWRIAL